MGKARESGAHTGGEGAHARTHARPAMRLRALMLRAVFGLGLATAARATTATGQSPVGANATVPEEGILEAEAVLRPWAVEDPAEAARSFFDLDLGDLLRPGDADADARALEEGFQQALAQAVPNQLPAQGVEAIKELAGVEASLSPLLGEPIATLVQQSDALNRQMEAGLEALASSPFAEEMRHLGLSFSSPIEIDFAGFGDIAQDVGEFYGSGSGGFLTDVDLVIDGFLNAANAEIAELQRDTVAIAPPSAQDLTDEAERYREIYFDQVGAAAAKEEEAEGDRRPRPRPAPVTTPVEAVEFQVEAPEKPEKQPVVGAPTGALLGLGVASGLAAVLAALALVRKRRSARYHLAQDFYALNDELSREFDKMGGEMSKITVIGVPSKAVEI